MCSTCGDMGVYYHQHVQFTCSCDAGQRTHPRVTPTDSLRNALQEALDQWESYVDDQMCGRPMAHELRAKVRIGELRKLLAA